MDRLLEEDAFVFPRQGGNEGGPAMDVYEEGDYLVIAAHVPGVKPDDLDVNVEHGVLTNSGQTRAQDGHAARRGDPNGYGSKRRDRRSRAQPRRM